jgi:hypothetical protein
MPDRQPPHGDEPPLAIIKSSFFPVETWLVERITARYITLRWNDIAVGNFRRVDGYATGDSLTRSRISNHAEINAWADARGGTWSRPKPKGGVR